MRVRDLMTTRVQTCQPHESLEQIARRMWEEDLGALPVLDGGRVVAVVTDRDACMAAYTRGARLADLRVQHCMSRGLVSCGPDDPLDDALARMAERRVRRLPVVDETGALVGLLSLADAARAGDSQHKLHSALATTLAAIQTSSEPAGPEPVATLKPAEPAAHSNAAPSNAAQPEVTRPEADRDGSGDKRSASAARGTRKRKPAADSPGTRG